MSSDDIKSHEKLLHSMILGMVDLYGKKKVMEILYEVKNEIKGGDDESKTKTRTEGKPVVG